MKNINENEDTGFIDLSVVEEAVEEEKQLNNKSKAKLKKAKLKKKKRKKRIKIAVLITEIIVILITSCALALLLIPNAKEKLLNSWIGEFIVRFLVSEETYYKIYDDSFESDDVIVNPGVDIADDYLNVVLFGLDTRNESLDKANSDSIIIASISKKEGTVKMVSVYRDTLLKCLYSSTSSDYEKVNSAYSLGGALSAIQTLNANLDLNITDYVSINFSGVANLVDAVGGIDVDLTYDEVFGFDIKFGGPIGINGYLVETREITGIDCPDVTEYGKKIHLNGLQAAAYCRLRYVTFYDDETGEAIANDLGRTARQRNVIKKVISKLKQASISEITAIADAIFEGKTSSGEPFIKTSLDYEEVMGLIPTLYKFNLGESIGFPFDYKFLQLPTKGSIVAPANLESNVVQLHKFLFGADGYEPTSNVLTMSNAIYAITGAEAVYHEPETPAPTTENTTQ